VNGKKTEEGEPTLRTITIQADKPLDAIMEQWLAHPVLAIPVGPDGIKLLRGIQDADETGAERADDRRRDRPAGLARRGDLVGEVPSVVGEVPGVSRRPR
jgi:hypothetical protein